MHESYHTSPGDPASYAAGPYRIDSAYGEVIPPGSQGDNGLPPQYAVHLTRHVESLYLDADNEITSRLLLGIAGRYSNYSDYGSSTTGKASAALQVHRGFPVSRRRIQQLPRPCARPDRHSHHHAQLQRHRHRACRTPRFCRRRIRWPRPRAASPCSPRNRPIIPRVSPGARPANTSVTLDVYQIRIWDRITPTGQITGQPRAHPPDIAAVTFLTNGLDTITRGLDFVVSHSQPLAGGELKLSARLQPQLPASGWPLHGALTNRQQRESDGADSARVRFARNQADSVGRLVQRRSGARACSRSAMEACTPSPTTRRCRP